LKISFDGDTVSANILFTEEAKAEVAKLLKSKIYYVNASNKMNFSASSDTIDYVLKNITG